MALANLNDLRLSFEAFRFGAWASIAKPAAWRRVYWAGHLSLQSDLLSLILWVRYRDCRDQGLRVGVQWILEEFLAGGAKGFRGKGLQHRCHLSWPGNSSPELCQIIPSDLRSLNIRSNHRYSDNRHGSGVQAKEEVIPHLFDAFQIGRVTSLDL